MAYPGAAAGHDAPGSERIAALEAQFLAAYPTYETTRALDRLRETDYGRLDRAGQTYLDYTGASLYAERQVAAHMAFLRSEVLGNPHSANPASRLATGFVNEARAAVLAHFGASAEEYAVVFTPNATGAIKLVAESFPFGAGSELLLTFDNHNSVNGMREYADARGAPVTYIPLALPDLRVDEERLMAELDRPAGGARLFAYPAQSNFTGVRHPLDWIEQAQLRGWTVLLDAAAYVPTSPLDLGTVKPDFVALSFYKMFGYPTGVGCLLARRDALARLARPWYAGGTTVFSSVQNFHGTGTGHHLTPGHEGFEDGTINFLAIPAVTIGLRYLGEDVGVHVVRERVRCLTGWLLDRAAALRHGNGAPLVEVYGPRDLVDRGGTVLLNVLRPDGARVDANAIQADAAERGISVRSGCHCNPGGCEVALSYRPGVMVGCAPEGRGGEASTPLSAPGHLDGAVRVSFGVASTFGDVVRLVDFLESRREA